MADDVDTLRNAVGAAVDAHRLLGKIADRGLAQGGEQSPNRIECVDAARTLEHWLIRAKLVDEKGNAKPTPRPAIMHEAHVVMFVGTSTKPATVLGASIFSEPQPTVDGPLRVVALFKVSGESYAAAAEAAWQVLKSKAFDWLGELDHPKRTRIAVLP